MALAQRFSLARLSDDWLVSDQKRPSLFLHSLSKVCLARLTKFLIARIKINTGAYFGLGP